MFSPHSQSLCGEQIREGMLYDVYADNRLFRTQAGESTHCLTPALIIALPRGLRDREWRPHISELLPSRNSCQCTSTRRRIRWPRTGRRYFRSRQVLFSDALPISFRHPFLTRSPISVPKNTNLIDSRREEKKTGMCQVDKVRI